MKALKIRRRHVARASAAPSLQIDLDGDSRRYTRLLPKNCEVLGVVRIAGDDHGALVRLASTGALIKATGGKVTMLNQSLVWMKLKLLEMPQHRPALKMVEADLIEAL